MSEYDRLNESATPRPWDTTECSSGGLILLRPAHGGRKYHEQSHVQIAPAADAAFIVTIANAADDMKRLWEAARPQLISPGLFECRVCDFWANGGEHEPDCPREALRPLFGEVE